MSTGPAPTPAPTPDPKPPVVVRWYQSKFIQDVLDGLGRLIGAHPQQGHISAMAFVQTAVASAIVFVVMNDSDLPGTTKQVIDTMAPMLLLFASWLSGSNPMPPKVG